VKGVRKDAGTLSLPEYRRLFFVSSLMAESTAGSASTRAIAALIRRLGFVQLDTISIVERAHHHILWARRHAYRPATLERLQRSGNLFEHFTHDASLIPAEWFPHWRHRFQRVQWSRWFGERLAGRKDELLAMVRERIRNEGPLLARHFDDPDHKRGAWWDWKPAKAALEYLWRTGELAIPQREGFEKVYELTERVMPAFHELPTPDEESHIAWACTGALERIGAGTAGEIAAFWKAVSPGQARVWAEAACGRGEIERVAIETLDGTRNGFAVRGWKRRLRAAEDPSEAMRILSPFDPLVRDRARCGRVFGFRYRFEAFVPAGQRSHGYFVLPVLRGQAFVARIDPKMDRATGTLHVKRVWWEPGVRPTRALKRSLGEAIEGYGVFCGADRIKIDES